MCHGGVLLLGFVGRVGSVVSIPEIRDASEDWVGVRLEGDWMARTLARLNRAGHPRRRQNFEDLQTQARKVVQDRLGLSGELLARRMVETQILS
jgi:hypothetical protein